MTQHQTGSSYPTRQGTKIKLQTHKGASRGDIIIKNGIKKKYNGHTWRRLCGVDYCLRESQSRQLCCKHSSEMTWVAGLMVHKYRGETYITSPRKGDFVATPEGFRRIFNGKEWEPFPNN